MIVHMHLESFKVFSDVARLGSFSQAAAENHLSQSAVSQIVHQLEKRVGVQLIDRSSRPPRPTELAQTLAYIKASDGPEKGYGDVLWALLNSSEFTLNH